MSTVVEIQQAIVQLSEREKRQLARWFEEQLEEIWDAEIEETSRQADWTISSRKPRRTSRPAGLSRSMKSSATAEFWQHFALLPAGVQQSARKAYRLWVRTRSS